MHAAWGQLGQQRCHRMFDYRAYEQRAIKAEQSAMNAAGNLFYFKEQIFIKNCL